MPTMIWSKDGYTLYFLMELQEPDGYMLHEYKAKIPFDWLQPAENYIYMGGKAHLTALKK